MYHSTIFYFIFHFSLLRICEYGHVFTGMQEEASELCSEHSLSVSKDPDFIYHALKDLKPFSFHNHGTNKVRQNHELII